MRANHTAFPSSVAFAQRFIDRAQAVEGLEVLTLVIFQVNAQVVLESTIGAELALASGEFIGKHSGAAKALGIVGLAIAAVGILALLFLLVLLVLLASTIARITTIAGSSLGSIVGAYIGGTGLGFPFNAVP
jgi:hypothetical protein